MKLPIYLDNQATTPVDPRVIEAMQPYFMDMYGNVGSAHCFGRAVRKPVSEARTQVADLIGGTAEEIIFTSGATESNNLAIKGIAWANRGKGKHIITTAIEHKSVLATCLSLEEFGFAVTVLPVDAHGQVSAEQVRAAIRCGQEGTTDRTVLISIMGANNEIGSIQPVKEIGTIAREAGVFFHVDAVQAAGKIPFDVNDVQADLVSVSGHKMYSPKGIGALYIRKSNPKIPLAIQMHGGGQECGLRSGTVPVPLVVAMGKAAELARLGLQDEIRHMTGLRERFWNKVRSGLTGVRLNGHDEERVPGNLSLTFAGIDGEMLMLGLKDVACSSSSACSAGAAKPSYVLKAIGLTDDEALATLRVGIGRFNTAEEIDYAAQKLVEIVQKQRISFGALAPKNKEARAELI